MRSSGYRPRRSFGSELFGLLPILAMGASVVAVFPFEAVGFDADEAAPAAASCRFVTLSPAELAQVKARSRAAWQVGVEGVRQLEADLLSLDSAAAWVDPVLSLGERSRFTRGNGAAYELEAVPAELSVAAPSPAPLPAGDPDRLVPPFDKADLLLLK